MNRQTVSVLVGSVFLTACGLTPQLVSKSDERLKPLWEAVARVDREQLGFTPIAANTDIRLEGKSLFGDEYDAMLHIDGETSRTIAFRRTGSGYEWIGEQEIHTGPGSYTDPDGTFKETITITYETQHVSGVPLNKVHIEYRGDDRRLGKRFGLTLPDVKPILQEWKQKR